MIKLKRLTEEVKEVEVCSDAEQLGNCYAEEKEKQEKEVDKLLKIKRTGDHPFKDIEPTEKPILESYNVKDRKELAELLEKLKSEGKKGRIGRSKVEGFRYTVKVTESVKLKEDDEPMPDAQPEEPIVVSTEDEVGKEESIKESTRFSLISTIITELWEQVNNYKGTLTTLSIDENKDVELEEILNNLIDETLVNIGLLNKLIGVDTETKVEETPVEEPKEDEVKEEE